MLRRPRLWAVRWLLLAALIQVTAPARALLPGGPGFICPEMLAAAGVHDMAEMPGMAGMHDMADMPGMDMGPPADAHPPAGHGKAPDHREYDCHTGSLLPQAAVLSTLWRFAPPARRIVHVQPPWTPVSQAPETRTRLRPAIRAPPLAA